MAKKKQPSSSGSRTSDPKPIRTIIVDDNVEYRTGLIEYLQTHGGIEVIGEANGGAEAITLTEKLDPDLVLMDISMPGIDGPEATRRIKSGGARAKIVFVTIHEKDTYRGLADLLHVDGFVCKSSVKQDLPEVLRRIRSELRPDARHA